jgi:hypothetical protein
MRGFSIVYTERAFRPVLAASGRRIRDRLQALLAVAGLAGSLILAAGQAAPVMAAAVDHFTITAVSAQTAGVPFSVTVTAYRDATHVSNGYGGGAILSGNLSGTAFGCTGPCSPSYGTLTFAQGMATASVTAYKAESGVQLNVADGAVSVSSNTFDVGPNAVDSLRFSVTDPTDPDAGFNGQPIDTKTGAPIYSVCRPPSASATNPCGLAAPSGPSTPVKVLARDHYSNHVLQTVITIGKDPAGTGLGSATTANGVADFGDLTGIGSIGDFKLKAAAASGTVTTVSVQQRIVNDLDACDNQVCKNNTDNGNATKRQGAFGEVSTTSDFFVAGTSNVLLTTQFLAGSTVTDQCGSNKNIGDATEIRVEGLGVTSTAPATRMVLIIPKDTLKAFGILNRGTDTFQVCLGAFYIGDPNVVPSPWSAKVITKKGGLTPSVHKADSRFWGVPADCGTAGLAATDPCIGLRTKSSPTVQSYLGMTDAEFATLNIKDADLVIAIEKPFPWDGRAGVN